MLPNPNLKIVPNRVKKLTDELDIELIDSFCAFDYLVKLLL